MWYLKDNRLRESFLAAVQEAAEGRQGMGNAFFSSAITVNHSKFTFVPFLSDSTNFSLLSWVAQNKH